jgi:two-component sensor histidine kinase
VASKGIKPTVRETIGWFVEEGYDFIKIVWDRGTRPRLSSTTKERNNGIVLVKQLVLEVGEVCSTSEVEGTRG